MLTNKFKTITQDKVEDYRRPISYFIDGSQSKTLKSFYKYMKKEFSFFKGFGNNWDALFDSLCDLELEENCVVYITNYNDLFKDEKNRDECLETLNKILWDVIEYYKNPESRGTGYDYYQPTIFMTIVLVK